MNINYNYFVDKANTSEIKRIKAKIISVSEDNKKAVVETIDQETRLELNNKSGELLSVGDYVTVEYSDFLSSKTAYIYMRNGTPQFLDTPSSSSTEINRVKAQIVSVSSDNKSALVEIIDDGTTIELYNKTGELLSVGDYVTIEYSDVLSTETAYIYMRDGIPQYMIQQVVVGDGVEFTNDGRIKTIVLPDSVTSIGNGAFSYFSSLTNITIPNTVTSIGNGAFNYCSSLSDITIPDSVTSIGDTAFYYCTSLTSITIPDSVTKIGSALFYQCSKLKYVKLPNSITSLGSMYIYGFFQGCSSLEDVTIPNSVTSIGDGAFCDCTSLSNIYFTGTEEQWNAISKGNGWNANMGASVSGGTQIHYNYTP